MRQTVAVSPGQCAVVVKRGVGRCDWPVRAGKRIENGEEVGVQLKPLTIGNGTCELLLPVDGWPV